MGYRTKHFAGKGAHPVDAFGKEAVNMPRMAQDHDDRCGCSRGQGLKPKGDAKVDHGHQLSAQFYCPHHIGPAGRKGRENRRAGHCLTDGRDRDGNPQDIYADDPVQAWGRYGLIWACGIWACGIWASRIWASRIWSSRI